MATKPKEKPKSSSAKQLAGGGTSTAKAGDVLVSVASEVENLSQKDAFALVYSLSETAGETDFRLGGVLSRIKSQADAEGGEAWLDGCPSFNDLLGKFGLHYRKAMTLIKTYNHLVEKAIPYSAIKGIGWTKLAIIAPIVTPKNVETWVKRAEKNTAVQLADLVSKANAGSASSDKEEKSGLTTKTFKLHKDQKTAVEAALEKVKTETKTEHDSVALFQMSEAYLGNTVVLETEQATPPEGAAKPKSKKARLAYYSARFKALYEEIKADDVVTETDDQVTTALDPFDVVFAGWKIEVNSPA